MPSDDGLRLEDFHRVQHLGSQVIEPRKHQAIDIADDNPLGRPTPQHIELMPKGERTLGLTIPPNLLAVADEVIE